MPLWFRDGGQGRCVKKEGKGMFCTSCGKELEEGSALCKFCGARQDPEERALKEAGRQLEQSTSAPSQTGEQPPQPEGQSAPAAGAPKEKKPLPWNSKLALIGLACVVTAAVALKLALGAVSAPHKTINKFLLAIQTRDGGLLASVTEVLGGKIELSETTLEPFFAAYSEDDGAWSQLQSKLLEDLACIDQGLTAQPGESFVRLVEYANPLFSTYKVELTPVNARLYSEFDGTKLTLGGTEYTASTEGTQVKLLPGRYSGTATYLSEETGVELTREFTDENISQAGSELWCWFDYTSAELETNYPDVTVTAITVDGRGYTGDLSQCDPYHGGFPVYPVGVESTVQVTFTLAGMEFKQDFHMEDDSSCWLEPDISDDLRAEGEKTAADVAQLIMQLTSSYDTALVARLRSTYGETSPDFAAEWEKTIQGQRAYFDQRAGYTGLYEYSVYNDLTAGTVDSSLGFDNGIISLECEVPLTYSSKSYYDWATGEPRDDYNYSGSSLVTVDMIYANGHWTIQRVY